MTPVFASAGFQVDVGPGTIAIAAVLLAGAFFFSGTETALFSLQKVDRQRIGQQPGGARLTRLLERRTSVLTTVLIGNETVNIGLAAIGASVFAALAPDLPWLNIVVLTPLLVLFAEVTPKILAFRFNRVWARLAVWPITVFYFAFAPIRSVVAAIVGAVARALFRVEPKPAEEGLREAEIMDLLEQGAESGNVAERERDIVEAVFEFGELTVGRLMTPRPDVFAVPNDISWDDLFQRCKEAGFSRVPVYQRRLEDIVGVLLLKDLLQHRTERGEGPPFRTLRPKMLPPVFVPQSKPANAMLREFLAQKYHMAFVVDEHGTLVGLVTLDDLLSELVGEFLDQEEPDEGSISSVVPGQYTVKAWMDVEDFHEETGIELPRDGYHTVGGFVFHQLGRLPQRGDEVVWGDHRFVVVRMEGRRIAEVTVHTVEPRPAAGTEGVAS